MAKTYRSLRRGLLASAVAALGSTTACGTEHRTGTASRQLPATGGATLPGRADQRLLPHLHPARLSGCRVRQAAGSRPRARPRRAGDRALAPGRSAWAGLRYASPEVSGARAATPAALLVTPPDERESLRVRWTAGEVPVGGNASSVFLTVPAAGSGP